MIKLRCEGTNSGLMVETTERCAMMAIRPEWHIPPLEDHRLAMIVVDLLKRLGCSRAVFYALLAAYSTAKDYKPKPDSDDPRVLAVDKFITAARDVARRDEIHYLLDCLDEQDDRQHR